MFSAKQSSFGNQRQIAISPYLGETISTTGIVTGIHAIGYLIQAESTA